MIQKLHRSLPHGWAAAEEDVSQAGSGNQSRIGVLADFDGTAPAAIQKIDEIDGETK